MHPEISGEHAPFRIRDDDHFQDTNVMIVELGM
jgi:hypothetical protein